MFELVEEDGESFYLPIASLSGKVLAFGFGSLPLGRGPRESSTSCDDLLWLTPLHAFQPSCRPSSPPDALLEKLQHPQQDSLASSALLSPMLHQRCNFSSAQGPMVLLSHWQRRRKL